MSKFINPIGALTSVIFQVITGVVYSGTFTLPQPAWQPLPVVVHELV